MSAFGFAIHQDRAAELARSEISWLIDRGHEVRLVTHDAEIVGRPDLGFEPESFPIGLDVVVTLGGDGTMLRGAMLAADEGVPLLGVNLGQLGYLTEVEPSGMRAALKRFLSGSYAIEERMRLEVFHRREDTKPSEQIRLGTALNECVIEKSQMGHTVRLNVALDGRRFTRYITDGLILGTPTGSTAYSFSVRAPIVDPRHRAIIMTPIAPHMLFDRSLVLQPDCEIEVVVEGERPAGVSIDGQGQQRLVPGDSVMCRVSAQPTYLITFGEHDFHNVLREKFQLAER